MALASVPAGPPDDVDHLAAHVRRVVDELGALTPAQRDRLAVLLRPPPDTDTKAAA